jgi:orotidine-5'-phosphate decarboxylase
MLSAKDRVIVALDVDGIDQAKALVERLAERVGMFKIGSQLFSAQGPELVRWLIQRGEKVFLDLKYHDIPNTVARAVAAASRLGVSLLDVHALGGKAMLEAAVAARPNPTTRLLAITILTSHDQTSLAQIGIAGPVDAAVRRLALLAREAGMDGVVCSPHEAALVREACGLDSLIVTPGIRPAGTQPGDQARAGTPAAALAAGASYIVVGRPITAAADPGAAADAIVGEVARALKNAPR